MSDVDTVRAFFTAFRSGDRAAAERLVADEFRFTSPQDDHIDRAAYFERCFPTADHFRSQELLQVVSAGPAGVFVQYEYELQDGKRYRNAEFITVRGEQVAETSVFFGGSYDRSS